MVKAKLGKIRDQLTNHLNENATASRDQITHLKIQLILRGD